QASLKNGGEWYWHGRMIVRGQERWMEVRSNFEKLADGSVCRRGIIQDVTDRREYFKESELRYDALVERLPIGIVVHNHGKLVYANAQAHEILGAAPPSLVNTHVLNYIHPDYRDNIVGKLKEVAA